MPNLWTDKNVCQFCQHVILSVAHTAPRDHPNDGSQLSIFIKSETTQQDWPGRPVAEEHKSLINEYLSTQKSRVVSRRPYSQFK